MLSGHAIEEVDERGEPITGDTFLVLLNAHSDKVPFTLPALDADQQWQRVVDTSEEQPGGRPFRPKVRYPLQGRSVAVFKMIPPLRERRRVTAAAQTPVDAAVAAAPPAPEPEPVPVASES
jgi:glycogen operon protein